MKPQLIFGVLTIATGLFGGAFTHPAIAKHCCVSGAALKELAQIAHRIPPQQTSPILIATAYTELTLPTLRQGDRGRNVELLQRILQDNGFLGAAGVRLGNPSGAIVDGIFGAVTAFAVRDLQQRYQIPVTGRVNPTTWEVLDMHENPYRSLLPWKQGFTSTTCDYDTFGNLKSVLDPAGGLTTMKYDVGSRLIERSLPNGVKSVYQYDDLDRVESITHTNTAGQVLASVSYGRNGIVTLHAYGNAVTTA